MSNQITLSISFGQDINLQIEGARGDVYELGNSDSGMEVITHTDDINMHRQAAYSEGYELGFDDGKRESGMEFWRLQTQLAITLANLGFQNLRLTQVYNWIRTKHTGQPIGVVRELLLDALPVNFPEVYVRTYKDEISFEIRSTNF